MDEAIDTGILKESEWLPEVETKLSYLGTEISDLFQRYGHALDRIIRLEEKVRLLESKANLEENI